MLRVMCGPDDDPSQIPYDELEVASIDIKYKPVFDKDQSTYSPDRDLFSINEIIIEDYVDSVETRERILEGYSLIKNEDTKDNN